MARGGFPGMGNMGNMMKQMQKVQKQMEEMQSQLEETEVEASSGGGAVTVKVNGKKEILGITIDESVVDPEDIEMLQDLIMAAVNEALRKAENMMAEEMKKLTGGMNIPGLF
ncbi:YbaB/EbfC family nucleoid-associated protein [Tissierella sp. MSJ-40]|jgi:DNA-binding YbaB/EbfC family protein|uniref:Nucleoid-associated protein KQI42_04030 n=1 Tax=Tissierella simiarum TaxID=2841534 RepID=A0ABS6E2N2_9FIRM|nr:YbaB/EbfC family nucleoid-associated protein [Tissierella simiarum]MBU5437165.1 YbaB/EbfC family nucleoid-associated protein [Tissierella simiarum]